MAFLFIMYNIIIYFFFFFYLFIILLCHIRNFLKIKKKNTILSNNQPENLIIN